MQLKRKIVKFVKFVTAFDPGHLSAFWSAPRIATSGRVKHQTLQIMTRGREGSRPLRTRMGSLQLTHGKHGGQCKT